MMRGRNEHSSLPLCVGMICSSGTVVKTLRANQALLARCNFPEMQMSFPASVFDKLCFLHVISVRFNAQFGRVAVSLVTDVVGAHQREVYAETLMRITVRGRRQIRRQGKVPGYIRAQDIILP